MSNLFINQFTLVKLNIFDLNSKYSIMGAAQYFFYYFTGIQSEQQT